MATEKKPPLLRMPMMTIMVFVGLLLLLLLLQWKGPTARSCTQRWPAAVQQVVVLLVVLR